MSKYAYKVLSNHRDFTYTLYCFSIKLHFSLVLPKFNPDCCNVINIKKRFSIKINRYTSYLHLIPLPAWKEQISTTLNSTVFIPRTSNPLTQTPSFNRSQTQIIPPKINLVSLLHVWTPTRSWSVPHTWRNSRTVSEQWCIDRFQPLFC